MAQSVSAKGFPETTIADVASIARVSRRTFYEHFGSKADCLIALFESVSDHAFQVLAGAIDPTQDWHAQVETSMRAYLGLMASNPVLVETLFIAIFGLGEDGLKCRRRANERLANLIMEVAARSNLGDGRQRQVSREIAMCIVGGIHELILEQIEVHRTAHLSDLAPTAAYFIRTMADGSVANRSSD